MNSFPARVERGRAVAGGFRMEVQPGIAESSAVTVRIRPHDIELSRGLGGLRAVVRRTSFLGALVRVEVALAHGGPQLVALVPRRDADRLRLDAGTKVRVRIRAGRVTPMTTPPGARELAARPAAPAET